MNKDQFYAIDADKRVNLINEMLVDTSLKEVAEEIGVPPSSFSKEMQRGDYVYIKRENQFYKFVRDSDSTVSYTKDNDSFIEENINTLKKLVMLYRGKTPLIIDDSIFKNPSKYTNKNIKMNGAIYKEFLSFCEKNYPLFRIQDMVAQSLIDFMDRYNK